MTVAIAPRDLAAPQDHFVNLYDHDDDLIADVIRFLAEGLCSDEAAVVVASSAHRDAFDAGLRAYGVDTKAAHESGRYVSLDAASTLSSLMVAGAPNEERFATVIGGVIAEAGKEGRPVRAFGEMVALLWDDDNVLGAIELESLWNQLAGSHTFSLYCAYPVASLVDRGDLSALSQVCAHHSAVVAPKSYGSAAPQGVDVVGSTERSHLFVGVPLAVRSARRFVAEALHGWGDDGLVDTAAVVTSELASNAVLHAGGPFRVAITRSESTIRIAVEDTSPAPLGYLDLRAGPGGGRGVVVVGGLSTSWGTEVQSGGKSVWAELPRPSHR